jgi:hypothetical protein
MTRDDESVLRAELAAMAAEVDTWTNPLTVSQVKAAAEKSGPSAIDPAIRMGNRRPLLYAAGAMAIAAAVAAIVLIGLSGGTGRSMSGKGQRLAMNPTVYIDSQRTVLCGADHLQLSEVRTTRRGGKVTTTVRLSTDSSAQCDIFDAPQVVRLATSRGTALPTDFLRTPNIVPPGSDVAPGAQWMFLDKKDPLSFEVTWANWCGKPPGSAAIEAWYYGNSSPATTRLDLADAPGGSGLSPACTDRAKPSTVAVTFPVPAASSAPAAAGRSVRPLAQPPCTASQLDVTWAGGEESLGSSAYLHVYVTNLSARSCLLDAPPALSLRSARGPVVAHTRRLPFQTVLPLVLAPGESAVTGAEWTNYCGPAPSRLAAVVTIGGTSDRSRYEAIQEPTCSNTRTRSTLGIVDYAPYVGPFGTSAPPTHRDGRK